MMLPLLLGGPQIGPAEWALPGDNALISPQVVDDGPPILSIFAAPWAVSIIGKMPEGIRIMNPF